MMGASGTVQGKQAALSMPLGSIPFSDNRWYYRGPDGVEYGPYSSREMINWSSSGYFNESLLMRSEQEQNYHQLGDWQIVAGGQLPFVLPGMLTFDALVHMYQSSRSSHPAQPAANSLLLFPPGLPPPFPPPNRFGGPFLPPAMLHAQQGQPMPQHIHSTHPLSQPPSEPHDSSSVSHTPDSEQEVGLSIDSGTDVQVDSSPARSVPPQGRINDRVGNGVAPTAHQVTELVNSNDAQTSTSDAPWLTLCDVGVDATAKLAKTDVATQTLPIIIPTQDASRILSELLGHTVRIS